MDLGDQDAEAYMSDASEVSSVNDAQETDDMDNTMTDLRKQILMVEARGKLDIADVDGEDTIDEIDARIAKKNSRQAHVQGGREQGHADSPVNNPFAKRPSSGVRELGQVETPVNNPFAKKSAAAGGREQEQAEPPVNNPFAKRAATAGGREGGKRPEHHAHADSSKSHVIQRVSSHPAHNRSESMQQGSSRDSADEDGSAAAAAAARVDSGTKHNKHHEERTTPRGGAVPHVSPRGGEAGPPAGWDGVALSLMTGRKPSFNQPKAAASRVSSDSDEDSDSESTLRVQLNQAPPSSGSQTVPRHGSVSSHVSSRKNSATIPAGSQKSSSQQQQQEEVIVAASPAQPPEDTWKCDKCNHVNVSVQEDEDACSNCAKRRVSTAAMRAAPTKGRTGPHSAQTKPQEQRAHRSAGHVSSAGRVAAVPVEADHETWDCKFCGETNIEEPEVNYCTFCAKYRQQGVEGLQGLRGAGTRGKKPMR